MLKLNRVDLNCIIIIFLVFLLSLYCLLGTDICAYAEQFDQAEQLKSVEEENAEWLEKMKYEILGDLFVLFAILAASSVLDVITGRPL